MGNDYKINIWLIHTGDLILSFCPERPLTIYNTKFDIRQWFLITSVQPLCIWMYRESYLRFSSQEYNLHNYHESVHLTNYAVQKKYEVNQGRDERLPAENMWDSYTFQVSF